MIVSSAELGMLHVEKSVFAPNSLFAESLPFEFAVGWDLPGGGNPYDSCGRWSHNKPSDGCLDLEAHSQLHLDGLDHVGQVYVKKRVQTCYRASCPVCYEDWVSDEADKATYRILEFAKRHKIIHVYASVPVSDYFLEYPKLRAKMYRMIKKCGIWGGMVMFHPWRQDELTLNWCFSPHFHILGCGWVYGTGMNYEKSGWVVGKIEDVGDRDPFSTIRYQLSHCGINEKYHSVTWFGGMNYRFKIAKMPEKVATCPFCGRDLKPVKWVGLGENPLEDLKKGGYWLDPGGWEYG